MNKLNYSEPEKIFQQLVARNNEYKIQQPIFILGSSKVGLTNAISELHRSIQDS